MSGWFTKSRQARAKSLDIEPQPFDVACNCGELVSGLRRKRYKTVACEECGDTLFVLPADVYPPIESAEKPSKPPWMKRTSRKPQAQVEQVAVEPIFEEDEPAVPAPTVSIPTVPAPVAITSEEVPAPAPAVLAADSPRRKFITPFRSVMLIAAIVVSLTAWWGLHIRRLDAAARIAQTERFAGNAALSGGELADAAEHYRRACDALEVLGRNDTASRETCRLAQETNAAANLTLHPLLKIVEEIHETLSSANNDDERAYAESHALSLYAGQWVVMETSLMPRTGDNSSSRWVLDYPFAIQSTTIELDANLPVFAPYRSQSQPQRVLFAAQLSKCRLIPGPKPRLVIEFNPQTAFLWTNAVTLEKIGLLVGDDEVDAETLALLDQQLRLSEDAP